MSQQFVVRQMYHPQSPFGGYAGPWPPAGYDAPAHLNSAPGPAAPAQWTAPACFGQQHGAAASVYHHHQQQHFPGWHCDAVAFSPRPFAPEVASPSVASSAETPEVIDFEMLQRDDERIEVAPPERCVVPTAGAAAASSGSRSQSQYCAAPANSEFDFDDGGVAYSALLMEALGHRQVTQANFDDLQPHYAPVLQRYIDNGE